MKVAVLAVLVLLIGFNNGTTGTAAWGQLFPKEHKPGYVPELYQSRDSIRSAIGSPEAMYTSEADWLRSVNARSEAYTRTYGGIKYYVDVFYGVEGDATGLLGPVRAVGFALTPYLNLVYPDLLPTIPWFKPLCTDGCDEMRYVADGLRFALICPPHPPAKDLDEARRLPLVRCLRVDFLPKKPHIFIIHYAEFRPAMEELLAEGPVEHRKLDAEYAPIREQDSRE